MQVHWINLGLNRGNIEGRMARSTKCLSSPYWARPLPIRTEWPVPVIEECQRYWDVYAMPRHIRDHSLAVALVALEVARQAATCGIVVDLGLVEAAALLHDIAKDYTIRWGGNHAQLGGVWTLDATGNPALALAVIHHVYWPWDLDVPQFILPLAVLYADKRVRHDRIVTLDERFTDLFERYGKTDFIRSCIEVGKAQAFDLERQLSYSLGVEYRACAFNSRRLVE